MKNKKTIKFLLIIGLFYELIRITLIIITTILSKTDLITILEKISISPYIPLINMIFIVYIFLDQKDEKEEENTKHIISTHLEIMQQQHKQLSNEHLGGTGSGDSILLALTVRVLMILESQNKILLSEMTQKEKFISGYKLMNEWAKYKSITNNYFDIIYLTFHEIVNSKYKDTYLPIFQIYLSEETIKAIACSTTVKLKKDSDFYKYLLKHHKSLTERFIKYGDEMNDIYEKFDRIYNDLEEKPDLHL